MKTDDDVEHGFDSPLQLIADLKPSSGKKQMQVGAVAEASSASSATAYPPQLIIVGGFRGILLAN